MKSKFALIMALGMAAALPAFAGPSSGKDSKAPAPIAPPPPEEPLGVTLTVGYDSDYVYRGVEFAKNLVTAAIDINVPVNQMWTINAGAWYGDSVDDSFVLGGSYHELDLYAAVLAKVGAFTIGPKYQHYFFFGDGGHALSDIDEVGLTASAPLGPIDWVGGAYYDFTADGWYLETGISHTFKINEWLSLVPAALISYASDYYGVDGFNHIKLSLSAPIRLSKTATLTPYVAGNIPIDSLKDLGEDERIYGGVSLSVSF